MKKILFVCLAFSLHGDLIEEAREHLKGCRKTVFSKEAYPKHLASCVAAIPRLKTAQEAIDFAQMQIPFDHREKISVETAALCEDDLRKEFPQFGGALGLMSESPFTRNFFVDYQGRKVSNVFYFQCWALFRCLSLGMPKMVCDVGSGYGFSAFLWMENPIYSPEVYLLADFPECLFFAEIYLKSNLKDVEIFYWGEKEISGRCVVLCPIGREEELLTLPIDWVINLGSLQHMAEEWVDYWMAWIDRSQAKNFYSLNFGIAPLRKKFWLCQGATDWAPRLSNQWSSLVNSAKGPFWPRDLCLKAPGELEWAGERTGLRRSREEIWEEFRKPRPWDRQGFAERLELVRLCLEKEMMRELISGALSEMGNDVPQEARYLAKRLKTGDPLEVEAAADALLELHFK